MANENCHIIGGDAEKQARKRPRREYVFPPAKPIGMTSFYRGIVVGRIVWPMTVRGGKRNLRRKDLVVTPHLSSVLPLLPLSTEYPIGKGFRPLPSFDLCEKYCPSHDNRSLEREKKGRHRVHVML